MALSHTFRGVHCETVATGTLLGAIGYDLSEAMLFGLGEGLAFVFLNLSSLPLPFLGGRTKPFALTEAICRNLGVALHAEETTSHAKAWKGLEAALGKGQPVGLQLDCFYLPYFRNAPHFAGHFVAAIGLDGDQVQVVDTVQQGGLRRVARADLERARHARGPMSARARAYTVHARTNSPAEGATATAALAAIRANAHRYLHPEFSGMGARGLTKLAASLPTWLTKAKSPADDLRLVADLMEKAGTGGALFRNLYRDFLDEVARLAPAQARTLYAARDGFARAAEQWTAIARLIERCARDGRAQHLTDAAALCRSIADAEVAAMRLLAEL